MGQTFVYNSGKEDFKRDELQFEFGVFIDGTLNNKDNTDMRTRFSRVGEDPDNPRSNKEIEKKEKDEFFEIKNRDRIKELIAKRECTPQEAAELKAVPPRHVYLVASHREAFLWNDGFVAELGTDKLGTDNSYSNDYTNVARMWRWCDTDNYRIYVEGMGTDKETRDSQDGFAFGAGFTGIRSRVRNACEQIAENIQQIKMKNENKKAILTKITIDVFGFSRGAAAARNFLYEISRSSYAAREVTNMPDGEITWTDNEGHDHTGQKYRKALVDDDDMEVEKEVLIEGKLPKYGHLGYSVVKDVLTPEEWDDVSVYVRFVGVYDTVSSYHENGKLGKYDANGKQIDDGESKKKAAGEGFNAYINNSNFNKNVKPLQLNFLGRYEKLVHFTALDEHRRNFSLTRIPNPLILSDDNNIRTIERNFPGVHCDIGGAYMTEEENVDEIGTSLIDGLFGWKTLNVIVPVVAAFWDADLKKLKQKLIDNHWYVDEELVIRNEVLSAKQYKKLTGKRFIKKEYSYIPLHFMETYARQTAMSGKFIEKLEDQYKLDDFLEGVKNHMKNYAMGKSEKQWKFVSDEEILKRENKKIEKKYEKILKEKEDYELRGIEPPVKIEQPEETYDECSEFEEKPIKLSEVQVLTPQAKLRKLRREYLHWSSNCDWLGMEPNEDRKRRFMS